jgi:hypothetical protein
MRKDQLLQEIRDGLPTQLRKKYLETHSKIGIHLAIMTEPFLTYLLSGQKTIESRFSINRVTPYNKVRNGDIIFIKSGLVVGLYVVENVAFYDLGAGDIETIRQKYNDKIYADNAFWQRKHNAGFATLINISNVTQFPAFKVPAHGRHGWVVLREGMIK